MRWTSAAALVALALLSGCAGKVAAPEAEQEGGPSDATASLREPDSPARLLDGIVWSWNRRDWRSYAGLLADDFQFAFATGDSAGNRFRNRALYRELEVLAMSRMFEYGHLDAPAMSSVSLTLGRAIVWSPDPRPGKSFPAHQMARANLVLAANHPTTSFRLTGAVVFYVVRGDSAQIPEAMLDRGYRPDASRWWLERWDDETLESTGKADQAMPTMEKTLGALKQIYLR